MSTTTARPLPTAHPYDDTDVIDARAPRFNQATIGLLSLLALLTGWWPLLTLLAVQLVLGLTLGRRWWPAWSWAGADACRASPTSASCSRASARAGSRTPAHPGSPTWSARWC